MLATGLPPRARGCRGAGRGLDGLGLLVTSAVLGTLSQKTSILMVPAVVCSVTDMMAARLLFQVHVYDLSDDVG